MVARCFVLRISVFCLLAATGLVAGLNGAAAIDKNQRFGGTGYNLPASDIVGATAGEFGITPGGMASYAVPITVPVGTTGVQPKLTLQFSSSGAKGVMGYGSSSAASATSPAALRICITTGQSPPSTTRRMTGFA
ncbi:MAG: hypothetical protein NW215_05185 [Hyphomicrobiales bacterium]|nr:hypothetical protein [Hyphomicrobiales bacterium]